MQINIHRLPRNLARLFRASCTSHLHISDHVREMRILARFITQLIRLNDAQKQVARQEKADHQTQ